MKQKTPLIGVFQFERASKKLQAFLKLQFKLLEFELNGLLTRQFVVGITKFSSMRKIAPTAWRWGIVWWKVQFPKRLIRIDKCPYRKDVEDVLLCFSCMQVYIKNKSDHAETNALLFVFALLVRAVIARLHNLAQKKVFEGLRQITIVDTLQNIFQCLAIMCSFNNS